MGSNKGGTRLGNWLTVLVVAICILALGGLALPATTRLRERAREAEVKASLHSIQLAIERYGQDMGQYPAYLIGGEARCAQTVVLDAFGLPLPIQEQATGDDAPRYPPPVPTKPAGFYEIAECERAGVSDPLLRHGYLDAYPRNPFAGDGQAIHWMQNYLATSATGNDPLRNAAAEGAALGTRFGATCTAMGQVLCDPRYPRWQYRDPATGASVQRDSLATVEYRFFDMWLDPRGREPYLPFAPGQFFYKSVGPYVAGSTDSALVPLIPEYTALYMLGTYGSKRTKGRDVIGDEQQIIYHKWAKQQPNAIGWKSQDFILWPWTRSVLGSQNKAGSPYSSCAKELTDTNEEVDFGNSNGISDGIILILIGGIDY